MLYVTSHFSAAVKRINNKIMKKSAQRRPKHCTLAVLRRSQNFCPAADHRSRRRGRPKYNQLEMVVTFTYRPNLVKMDARNFELSW